MAHTAHDPLPPTTFVIFGASGDLTRRKLVPALFGLHRKNRLPARTRVVGFARRPYSEADFRARLEAGVEEFGSYDAEIWKTFAPMLSYFQGDLEAAGDYVRLEEFLRRLEGGPSNRVYYLATAPELYRALVGHLGAAGMALDEGGRRNVVIEKPFGRDLATAQELNEAVHSIFAEKQIYRIDHYLGKETAQNVLYVRFANTIFEPVWNRRYVDHVQLTVAESVDVGDRAGYYDTSGVLRDMFQNHLLQLLTLVAMEPPASFNADALRNEKVKVLSAIRRVDLASAVAGQYRDYRRAPGVATDSRTPTFAALKLFIDNWRWQGVPFYLRSGKALAAKTSEIIIQFQCPPHVMFEVPENGRLTPNVLAIGIQPDESIRLKFETKVPDSDRETRSVDMEFHYSSSFPGDTLPDAYERLLVDALKSDASLFARKDEIELAWRLIDPVVEGWQSAARAPPAIYERGTWGPGEADALMAADGRAWRLECGKPDCGGA